MEFLHDTALLAGILNLINLCGNLYWSLQLKSVQGGSEVTKALKSQLDEKEGVIKELMDKKNQYKKQFQLLQTKHKELEGTIKTYQKFHKHSE